MGKTLKALFLGIFFITGLFSLAGAAEERLTISTYYPSPYGSYKKLTTSVLVTQRYASPDTDINWADGSVQSVSVSGASGATFTFAGGEDGGKYILILKYTDSGSGVFTWPGTVRWAGGTGPTLTRTVDTTDYVGFIYNGVDSAYDGVAVSLDFS